MEGGRESCGNGNKREENRRPRGWHLEMLSDGTMLGMVQSWPVLWEVRVTFC